MSNMWLESQPVKNTMVYQSKTMIGKGWEKTLKSELVHNRLVQATGLLLLLALTMGFIIAFRMHLLPYQEDGDAFSTVYAVPSAEPSAEESIGMDERSEHK